MSESIFGQGPSFVGDGSVILSREPPPIIWQGSSFTVSILVLFKSSQSLTKEMPHAFAVNVSLIDREASARTLGLRGNLTSDVQFHSDQHMGFAAFNDLAVHRTGQYQLRVLLGAITSTGMVIEGRIDSGTFQVSKSKNSIACATLYAEPGESTDICKSGLKSFGKMLDGFATNL